MSGPQVVVIVSGFPRHSETFALTELNALDDAGMLAALFCTKPGDAGACQPAARRLIGRVHLLEGDGAARLEEAAYYLDDVDVSGIHAYFAHTPAEVASDLAAMLGVPFGFSVHARDARKVPRQQLFDRAQRAACVVACNRDVAREFDGSGAHVTLVPHGVDVSRFAPRRTDAKMFRILAVGRLVVKKGFHVLIDALSELPGPWRLRVVGDGSEKGRLLAQVQALGLADRVTFRGIVTHDALAAEYDHADVVVVPSICDASGDRDGLPNVVLEGMASAAAIVATDAGAITSAVRDGDTGVVVPAGDVTALRTALRRLAEAPAERRRLGDAAREVAAREFDATTCASRFVSVLRGAYA